MVMPLEKAEDMELLRLGANYEPWCRLRTQEQN